MKITTVSIEAEARKNVVLEPSLHYSNHDLYFIHGIYFTHSRLGVRKDSNQLKIALKQNLKSKECIDLLPQKKMARPRSLVVTMFFLPQVPFSFFLEINIFSSCKKKNLLPRKRNLAARKENILSLIKKPFP